MNEFLESKKLILVKEGFDPDTRFHKDWINDGTPMEVTSEGAKFFHWSAPEKKEFFLVPWKNIYGQTNVLPAGTPGGYKVYPRPHDEIPAGWKLVWDVPGGLLPALGTGPMKLVPILAESDSFDVRVEKKLDRILEILGR